MIYKESEKCGLGLFEVTVPPVEIEETYKETDAGHLVVLSNFEPSTPYYKYRSLFLLPSVLSSFICSRYGSFL
jgi:hypothetical protein